MIRPAVISDLPRLEAMGARFFDASGLEKWFRYKPRCFSQVCANFMDSDQAVVLVGTGKTGAVAMAAAIAYPCWFDAEHQTCQELFWWVEPDFRGGSMGARLQRALEQWAKDKGCLTMEMGALEGLRADTLAHLYERQGYDPKERIYCRRLTA